MTKILVCPKCMSKNTLTPYMGAILGKYVCKKCGYVGSFVIEEY
jgi:transcription initiation factor TFIIIB Brf1 subunit/transcription initiation factor TFIIB